MAVGIGPLWRIDGPPPLPSQYGLLQAARAPEVRIIPDVDVRGVERWGNGAELYPYPPDGGRVYDSCGVYDSPPVPAKEYGAELPLPQYDSITVYLAETCTSYRVWSQESFRARAVAAFAAIEGAAVEREFAAGDDFVGNPHLGDGNGEFPNGDTPTSVMNALALLENELAVEGFGRRGVIHCAPAFAIAAAKDHLIADVGGVLRTINGTLVVAGAGYAQPGNFPTGKNPAAAGEEWIYGTGPIDIRRSEIFTVPETLAEALDRGSGATDGMPNAITYRVERLYMVTWDTVVQTAVLASRCQTSC